MDNLLRGWSAIIVLTTTGSLLTTRSWANDLEPLPSEAQVPSSIQQQIAQTEIQQDSPQIEQGVTHPYSTQAKDLLSPEKEPVTLSFEPYDHLAQLDPDSVQPNDANPKTQKPFSAYLGSKLPNPTALNGPTRKPIVPASSNLQGNLNLTAGTRLQLGEQEKLVLELRGGESILGGDLSFIYGSDSPRKGFAVNVFNQRAFSSNFNGGNREVDLPNNETPWVHRTGGGIEILRPLSPKIDAAAGVSYQRISVRDGLFSSTAQPIDELGNPLSVSGSGTDDLLTLNVATQYDTRDNFSNPTQGSRLRLGVDQSIPVGDASINMTRLHGSATQFIPFPLFGFSEGPRTLVLNVQGGHIFGDVPPYESFSLGGASTVRGYGLGDVGSGGSFLQATAEYRFPITSLVALKRPIDLSGTLFVDYANTLGTQSAVIGQPGLVRNKPGDGLGYGIGLRASTSALVTRLEFALNDQSDFEVHISIGERF
ncbi:BamA/TamA family outer membrane protein [Acaryochloris marina]|uniref:BamA/TamA family outer membrane protein n=1 Tax=Acaryochloris marina TaxID=155978 RepID=UPI001BAF8B35|nr:BamA/TamA family outer membrane protein [Acaryochloris marina]QUY45472.1 BamA/TamA family outer membrane protein [Acaryochloris marina S15]